MYRVSNWNKLFPMDTLDVMTWLCMAEVVDKFSGVGIRDEFCVYLILRKFGQVYLCESINKQNNNLAVDFSLRKINIQIVSMCRI